MLKVWCTCYRCKENTAEDGAYVSKSTRTYHRKHYQNSEQKNYSLNSNEIVSQDDNNMGMLNTFRYIILLIGF